MSDEYFKRRNRFDPVAMMNETLKLGEDWAENKTAFDSLKDTEATLKSKIFEELKNNGHNTTTAKELIATCTCPSSPLQCTDFQAKNGLAPSHPSFA